VLVLDMIKFLPPLGKYKYDTWRILLVKCYIDNSMRLRSCVQNINNGSCLRGDAPYTHELWSGPAQWIIL
jgi:hypothetical protein